MALVKLPADKTIPPANWTLLNAGGTALTSNTTITISSIPQTANNILILVDNASSVNASSELRIRVNADSGNIYEQYGSRITAAATYATTQFTRISSDTSQITIATMGTAASDNMSGYVWISGAQTNGYKTYLAGGGASGSGGQHFTLGGIIDTTAAVTSISIISSAGNFDSGTVKIYASE
jgi:hypothetical protein